MKHVCDPKTTKAQDDARNKKLTAGEIQQLIQKANSGDMSAIATLSRSYDFKSIIGTDTRTKEEIEAGNRLVWQNTVNSLKKIPYLLGEFFFVNDIYRLTTGKDPETGEAASRLEAAGWLTAGLASFGISKVLKGGKLAGKGLKALDKVNDASKVAKAADKAKDTSKATRVVDKASDATRVVDKVDDVKDGIKINPLEDITFTDKVKKTNETRRSTLISRSGRIIWIRREIINNNRWRRYCTEKT